MTTLPAYAITISITIKLDDDVDLPDFPTLELPMTTTLSLFRFVIFCFTRTPTWLRICQLTSGLSLGTATGCQCLADSSRREPWPSNYFPFSRPVTTSVFSLGVSVVIHMHFCFRSHLHTLITRSELCLLLMSLSLHFFPVGVFIVSRARCLLTQPAKMGGKRGIAVAAVRRWCHSPRECRMKKKYINEIMIFSEGRGNIW